ncbi:uncharacterized protein [Procambarus clarkii]|uniref:uncharacterized protein isoform X3 n=1 Tax=Procambarus clarkii TaxID=6728 RepID=UPI003742D74E
MEEDIYCCVLDQRVRGCGRSWQQRAAGKYLQIYKCGLESPEVPLSVAHRITQNQVKVIMMHGLAWSEAPLLCKRKSTKVGDCLWSCLGLLDLLFI